MDIAGGKDCWYRFDLVRYAGPTDECGDPSGESGPLRVVLHEFDVHHYTPKGVQLNIGGGSLRFVLRDSHKRFACPTIEEAKESFIARKKKEIKIHKARMRDAEIGIRIIEKGMEEKCVYDWQLHSLFDD